MKSVISRLCCYIPLCLLLISCCLAKAQTTPKSDTIIFRNDAKLEVIIKEIQEHAVSYKKINDPGGSVFTINKSEIARIHFASGDTKVFEDKEEAYFEFNTQEARADRSARKYKDGKFYNLPIKTLQNWDTEQLQTNYPFYLKKAERFHKMGITGIVTGITGSLLGIALLSTGNNTSGVDGFMQAMLGAAFLSAGLGAGIPLTIAGFLREKTYKKRAMLVNEELRKRNLPLGYQLAPAINPSNQLAGLALKMTF